MIRGIVFDCFGVLFGGSYQTLQSLCPADKLEELHDLNRQADYGFIESDEYVAGVAGLLEMGQEEVAQIFRAKHVRNQPLIDYVTQLRGTYRTALLSNVSNGIIETLFRDGELDELFDEVILSYREHAVKPNPFIFELTAERLGLTTGECVMIDDLEENCEGAEVAGMASILHTSNDTTIDILSKKLHSPD